MEHDTQLIDLSEHIIISLSSSNRCIDSVNSYYVAKKTLEKALSKISPAIESFVIVIIVNYHYINTFETSTSVVR
jgi:hypothetical protein